MVKQSHNLQPSKKEGKWQELGIKPWSLALVAIAELQLPSQLQGSSSSCYLLLKKTQIVINYIIPQFTVQQFTVMAITWQSLPGNYQYSQDDFSTSYKVHYSTCAFQDNIIIIIVKIIHVVYTQNSSIDSDILN